MSVQQVTFALAAEGSQDLGFLRGLVERAIQDSLGRQGLEGYVLPAIGESTRPSRATFLEWMSGLEAEYAGTSIIVVHQDCDARDGTKVLEGRWQEWRSQAAEPERWVLALPCRSMESWALGDGDRVSEVVRLSQGVLQELTGGRTHSDDIPSPKSVLRDVLARSGLRKPPPLGRVLERLSLLVNPAELRHRSPSYALFEGGLDNAIRRLYEG